MTNLRSVISFEVLRNLRKKTFWFAAIAPPILVLIIVGLSHASSQSANQASQQQTTAITKNSKIAVLDETGVISAQSLRKIHFATETTLQAGISAVKNGTVTAFLYYSRDVATSGIQIYAQDQGINNATPYNGLAVSLLTENAKSKAITAVHNPQIVQVLEKTPDVTATTYKNGKQTNDEADVIAPGIFLIAFLALVVLQAYLMINSTTEEKENRTAEILLTAIKSRTLVSGKIISLFILGLVQLLVIIIPLLIAYAVFRQHLTLPGGVTLSHIPLDPKAIALGALFFIAGVVVFTGFLVGFGSLFPNAQEAGRYLGMAIISAFLPICHRIYS